MDCYRTARAAVLAVLVSFCSVLLAGVDEATRDLYECYQDKPGPDELCRRLQGALDRHRGTDAEDDFMLALAKALIQAKRRTEAMGILERLAENEEAKKIDTADFWINWKTQEMFQVKALYEECPDFTCDHALLVLARVHLELGSEEKSWETFERLRRKYPKGDRVAEDLRLMREFRKTHPGLPVRFGWPLSVRSKQTPAGASAVKTEYSLSPSQFKGIILSQIFLRRRRPHLSGLVQQASLCGQLGRGPRERVAILKDIVGIYDPLLTEWELRRYCKQGLTEIEALEDKAEERLLTELDKARAVFTEALEGLAAEEREPATGDP